MQNSKLMNLIESTPIIIESYVNNIILKYMPIAGQIIELGNSNSEILIQSILPTLKRAHTAGATDGFMHATGILDLPKELFTVRMYSGNNPSYQFEVIFKNELMFEIGNLDLPSLKNIVIMFNTTYALSAADAELIMKDKNLETSLSDDVTNHP